MYKELKKKNKKKNLTEFFLVENMDHLKNCHYKV